MSSEAKVNASLVPSKSQVLLVAFVVACVISLLCGTYLISKGKQDGWGLIGLAGVIFLGTLWAWNKSQSDSDLDNAHPTTLRLADGTNVSTDMRTLRSPESALRLGLLIQDVLIRKPLPPPDALVNNELSPLPDTKEKAKAVVDKINQETQDISNCILDNLGLTDEDASNLQEISSESPNKSDLNSPKSLNKSTGSSANQ